MRGICYAPINIEFVVDHSNIVAQTFVEPVRVGRTLQGAIIATGGAQTPVPTPPGFLDGHIPVITIGDLAARALDRGRPGRRDHCRVSIA